MLTDDIVSILSRHPTGLTSDQLAKRLDSDAATVRRALQTLQKRKNSNLVSSLPGQRNTTYMLVSDRETVAARNTQKQPSNLYDGKELQRNPGITDDRMEAFSLPSRYGNWLHYPDGRKVRQAQ